MGGKKRKQQQEQRPKDASRKKSISSSTKQTKHSIKEEKTTAESTDDWITALAKQTAATDSSNGAEILLSKAERIKNRKAKKRRREERKPAAQMPSSKADEREDDTYEGMTRKRQMDAKSQACMRWLAARIISLSDNHHSEKWKSPYHCPESAKKGKATSGSGKYDEDMIQPRKRDYGGLGFARPSLFLSLRDPSFIPKLEEEFAEHIPGFFGKIRTKAMKKQLDGNMLWRKMAEKRTDDRKVDGIKLSDMRPDERVEAMIKAGMI